MSRCCPLVGLCSVHRRQEDGLLMEVALQGRSSYRWATFSVGSGSIMQKPMTMVRQRWSCTASSAHTLFCMVTLPAMYSFSAKRKYSRDQGHDACKHPGPNLAP